MKNWKKVWTEISEEFDAKPCKQFSGLCNALWSTSDGNINGWKIAGIINPEKNSNREFWWRTPPFDRNVRATFAGLMAAMGNKGFASFLKWCEENGATP